jgi:hypothetical protein
MEGFTLKRKLQEMLQEVSSSSFMNDRTTYDYLYAAVNDFNFRTHYSTGTQTISILPAIATYNLNPDYVCPQLTDDYNRPFFLWNYGGAMSNVYPMDYDTQVLAQSTTTSTVASNYSTVNAQPMSNLYGSATIQGLLVNGECILTDTTLSQFAAVSVGDYVHDTTDGSDGVVMGIISPTQIYVSLFGGVANQWSVGDMYVIIPQQRYSIVFYPTPSAVATATIYYVKAPAPVYSPYRVYNIPFQYDDPIISFAAFKYKYRDQEPQFGDALYQHYEIATKKFAAEMRKGIDKKNGFRVNFTKLSPRSKSLGGFYRR